MTLVSEQGADPLVCVVCSVSAVVVLTLCARDATTKSAGMASAIPSPRTNRSRGQRRKMPLTCTCSKDQNRLSPVFRDPKAYCIRRRRSGAISSHFFAGQSPEGKAIPSQFHGFTVKRGEGGTSFGPERPDPSARAEVNSGYQVAGNNLQNAFMRLLCSSLDVFDGEWCFFGLLGIYN